MQSPLTQKHLDLINRTLYDLHALVPEIDKAIRAGVDLTAQRQAAMLYQQRLMQIKSTYFPGQP